MSPVSASAITVADGEISLDAELLALKLGLSGEAMKTEMRKGNVSSVAETGIDEDAGRPRVVIVGAGFAGLSVAKRLAKTLVDITLIDRENHHLFQPLLYQVASAGL